MKIKAIIVLLFAAFLAAVAGHDSMADQESEEEAEKAAARWLSLVDAGKYSESWDVSAKLLWEAVSKESWKASLEGVKKPLGRLISRTLRSRQYATSLPGAPDGKYVVIQYGSSFENKKSAVETVTPVLEKDGKWRVSGYYIK